MPKQDFNINIAPAVAGEMYGLATTNSQRLTYNTEVEMSEYGLAVGMGSKSNTVKTGNDKGIVFGITMRENKLEANKRPSDGTIGIPKGQPLAVMLDGAINVKLAGAITTKNLFVDANGHFGGTSGEGWEPCTNVCALEYPASAGDVIGVMISKSPLN